MKPHISPSQLATFRTCPRLWAYTTLEGKRVPPAGAQHLGRSFHAAAEAHNRHKLATRTDMPLDEIEDRYAQAWKDTDPSEIQWDGEQPEKVYDDGAVITRLFGATSAREVQPVLIEQEVIIPAEVPILCRLDVVDEQSRVLDYKSASKAPSADAAEDSDQLTAYAAAHQVATGHLPSAEVLDIFVRPLKTSPLGRRFPITTNRSEEQVAIWLDDAKATVSQMKHAESTGLFPYADPSSWKCSEKWCGFWNQCPGGAARRSQVAFAAAK